MGSELVAVAQGAGGILGLSVNFLGSTIRSQKSEHDSRRGFARRSRWEDERRRDGRFLLCDPGPLGTPTTYFPSPVSRSPTTEP